MEHKILPASYVSAKGSTGIPNLPTPNLLNQRAETLLKAIHNANLRRRGERSDDSKAWGEDDYDDEDDPADNQIDDDDDDEDEEDDDEDDGDPDDDLSHAQSHQAQNYANIQTHNLAYSHYNVGQMHGSIPGQMGMHGQTTGYTQATHGYTQAHAHEQATTQYAQHYTTQQTQVQNQMHAHMQTQYLTFDPILIHQCQIALGQLRPQIEQLQQNLAKYTGNDEMVLHLNRQFVLLLGSRVEEILQSSNRNETLESCLWAVAARDFTCKPPAELKGLYYGLKNQQT